MSSFEKEQKKYEKEQKKRDEEFDKHMVNKYYDGDRKQYNRDKFVSKVGANIINDIAGDKINAASDAIGKATDTVIDASVGMVANVLEKGIDLGINTWNKREERKKREKQEAIEQIINKEYGGDRKKYEEALKQEKEKIKYEERERKKQELEMKNAEIAPFKSKYDDVSYFEDGFACVKLNNKWGYIDKNGTEVIPIKYDEVYNFYNGKAAVRLGRKEFYINKEGNKVKHLGASVVNAVEGGYSIFKIIKVIIKIIVGICFFPLGIYWLIKWIRELF